MAVTRQARILKLTALNDAFTGRIIFSQIRIHTTGGAAGELLVLQDNNNSLVAEYRTSAAAVPNDAIIEADKLQFSNGIKITTIPTGTVAVLVYLQ